uniref:Adenosylcobinamide-GDP ribazoletransferase n=1 Tax=Fervidobacterium thailandense TaxID=1008305 RepID=A0A7C4W3Z7_9BACT
MLYPLDRYGLVLSGFLTIPLVFLDHDMFVYSFGVSAFVGILVSVVSKLKIGGVTGDVLGGSCLMGQLSVLLIGYFKSR